MVDFYLSSCKFDKLMFTPLSHLNKFTIPSLLYSTNYLRKMKIVSFTSSGMIKIVAVFAFRSKFLIKLILWNYYNSIKWIPVSCACYLLESIAINSYVSLKLG